MLTVFGTMHLIVPLPLMLTPESPALNPRFLTYALIQASFDLLRSIRCCLAVAAADFLAAALARRIRRFSVAFRCCSAVL